MLDTDLRWRDPAGYEDLHRRVRPHIVDRIRGSEGRAQRKADYHRVPEADFTVGGQQHLVFAHDWRRLDVAASSGPTVTAERASPR